MFIPRRTTSACVDLPHVSVEPYCVNDALKVFPEPDEPLLPLVGVDLGVVGDGDGLGLALVVPVLSQWNELDAAQSEFAHR